MSQPDACGRSAPPHAVGAQPPAARHRIATGRRALPARRQALVLTPAASVFSPRRRTSSSGSSRRARHPRDGPAAPASAHYHECYTCYHWLPPLLADFRRRFPRVEVRIDVEATRRPIEMLLRGQARSRHHQLHGQRSPVVSRPVFSDEARRHRLAAPSLRRQTHVRSRRCATRPLFIYRRERKAVCCRRYCCPQARCRHASSEVQLTEAITELVKAGLGVAVLARWAVQPLVDAGTLVARPLTGAACVASGAP